MQLNNSELPSESQFIYQTPSILVKKNHEQAVIPSRANESDIGPRFSLQLKNIKF